MPVINIKAPTTVIARIARTLLIRTRCLAVQAVFVALLVIVGFSVALDD